MIKKFKVGGEKIEMVDEIKIEWNFCLYFWLFLIIIFSFVIVCMFDIFLLFYNEFFIMKKVFLRLI